MGFQEAAKTGFSKYATFQGRASRPEFWYWVLFIAIVEAVLAILGAALGFALFIILGLFIVATFLPTLAVTVRRLHDVNRSGWWWFIQFLPGVGTYWFLYFLVQPGTMRDPTPAPNRFGAGPAVSPAL
jgi:uncharacterized membrane protein YhaH (DUF805 family)